MSFLKSFIDGDLAAGRGPGGPGVSAGNSKLITIDRSKGEPSDYNSQYAYIVQFSLDPILMAQFIGQEMFIIADVSNSQRWEFIVDYNGSTRFFQNNGGISYTMTQSAGQGSQINFIPGIVGSDLAKMPTRILEIISYVDFASPASTKTFALGKEFTAVPFAGSLASTSSRLELKFFERHPSSAADNFAPPAEINTLAIWSNATIEDNPLIPWDNMTEMRKLIYTVENGSGTMNEPGETGSDIMGVQPDIFLWGGGEDPLKNDADGETITVFSNKFHLDSMVVKNQGKNSAGEKP